MKKLALLSLSIIIIISCSNEINLNVEKENKEEVDKQEEKLNPINVAILFNYCHYSLTNIIDYSDTIILDLEYENIINNINLKAIDDIEIINLMKDLMDQITYYRISEGDKQMLLKEYNNNMENAFYNGFAGTTNIVFGGGFDPLSKTIGIMSYAGSTYFNYKRNIAEYRNTLDKQLWEIEKSEIQYLNDFRKDFFDKAWLLFKKYNIPDEWRLTEKQLNEFIEIIKDKNYESRLRRLLNIEEDFKAFPPFSYYVGISYQESNDVKKAYEYYDQYINQIGNIFRYDPYLIDIYKRRIFMSDEEEEILNYIDKILDHANYDYDAKMFCGLTYLKLEKKDLAKKLIQNCIDNDYLIETNKFLMKYMKKNKDIETLFEEYVFKLVEKDVIENVFYIEKQDLNKIGEIVDTIKNMSIPEDGEKLTFQNTVIDKIEWEWWISVFKWSVIAVTTGIAIWLSAGILAPMIGGAIGGLAGLHGIAAVNYGLAFLGGGSLVAGGFGIAGGTTLITVISSLAVGVSIERGFSYLDSYDQYKEINQLIEKSENSNDKNLYLAPLYELEKLADNSPENLALTKYQMSLCIFSLGRRIEPVFQTKRERCFNYSEELLNSIYEEQPKSSISLYYLAEIELERISNLDEIEDPQVLLKNEHYTEYTMKLNKAIETEKLNHDPYISLANIYRITEQYTKSIEILKKYMEYDVDYLNSNLTMYQMLGSCYKETNDMENAIKYYKLAYDYEPNRINTKELADIYYGIYSEHNDGTIVSVNDAERYSYTYLCEFLEQIEEIENKLQEIELNYNRGNFISLYKKYYNRLVDLSLKFRKEKDDPFIKSAYSHIKNYKESIGHLEFESELINEFKVAVYEYNNNSFFKLKPFWDDEVSEDEL